MPVPKRLGAVRTRQAAFFLIAIVLPCALLVILTTRMLVQERELAEKRLTDERRRIAADVRQSLLDRVEHIRLEGTRGAIGDTAHQPELALLAHTDGGRLVLPWENVARAAAALVALDEARFRDAVRAGERAEFIDARPGEAAAAYARAVAGARLPIQRGAGHLLLARALSKDGRTADADELHRHLLQGDGQAIDEHGIPYGLYAARRLLDAPQVADETIDAIGAAVAGVLTARDLHPAAGYMARDVAGLLQKAASPAARGRLDQLNREVAARITDIEQALELQKAFPAALATRRSGGTSPTQVWIPFGPEANRWLVHAGDSLAGGAVVAVRADALLSAVRSRSSLSAAAANLARLSTEGNGELLLPHFPGLSLVIPPAAMATVTRDTGLQRPILLAALAGVLSTALFGAYLFWRDVRREIDLAQLRSQFVSSVSHELKTPLTAIRMFAETLLLGRSTRPEVSQEYLETIVNESERLTRLLNNVLDFSKIEQGTRTYRLAPHSAIDMVRAAVSAMRYPLAQQGVELRVELDEHVPPIAADPDAIQQALLNLLSNAMKYSGAGRVIDLALTQEHGHALITVTDRGIGIPPGEQKRIFDKFYRAPGVENQRIAGTGLGLTLVDHVARAHGGCVTVRSAPGEGSTFSLRLPLLPQPDPAVAATHIAGRPA